MKNLLTTIRTRILMLVILPLVCVLLMACGSQGPDHLLADYDFSTGTVAVVNYDPPAPELRTGGVSLFRRNPAKSLLSAGSRVARESHARDAEAKLDSAAQRVEFAPQMEERLLSRTARYLGAQPVEQESEASYLLEVVLDGIGLSAKSDQLDLFVEGEAVLLDTESGYEIWKTFVRSSDQMTENMVGDAIAENILGSFSLSQMTVEDFEALLPELAEYAADEVVQSLRVDLREVRSDE